VTSDRRLTLLKTVEELNTGVRIAEGQCIQVFGGETCKSRHRFEDVGIGRRVILKWILRNMSGRVCTGFMISVIGTCDGRLIHLPFP
jgi:hypothetical protein